jgi:hypothetical protein
MRWVKWSRCFQNLSKFPPNLPGNDSAAIFLSNVHRLNDNSGRKKNPATRALHAYVVTSQGIKTRLSPTPRSTQKTGIIAAA